MYQKGMTVYANHPGEDYHGQLGTIIKVDKYDQCYQVRMADGDFWFNVGEVTNINFLAEWDNTSDFDGGFGIGGLGRHTEEPMIPSVETLKRYEQRLADAEVCQRCGCSELDGAMFTTDPASGRCDDCLDS